VTGVFGAEATGGRLADLDETSIVDFRANLSRYEVVVVRDQFVEPGEQVAFSRLLGPSGETPFVATMPDHPEVIRVVKEADEGSSFNFGGAWHSDFSFQAEPPSFTILAAVDVPPWGGDTVFASMTSAWRALDPTTRDSLRSLRAVHTARDAYSRRMQPLHSGMRGMTIVCDDSADEQQVHPLVTRHPETGTEVLFFNRAYVRDLEAMERPVADELLGFLHHHATDARFRYRHRWRAGDVVIWDNRSVQHLAANDYAGFRRELHRTTVAGTAPRSA